MSLLFVHGRAQEAWDAKDLQTQWTTALLEGIGIATEEAWNEGQLGISFPFYGKTLIDTMNAAPPEVGKVTKSKTGAAQKLIEEELRAEWASDQKSALEQERAIEVLTPRSRRAP